MIDHEDGYGCGIDIKRVPQDVFVILPDLRHGIEHKEADETVVEPGIVAPDPVTALLTVDNQTIDDVPQEKEPQQDPGEGKRGLEVGPHFVPGVLPRESKKKQIEDPEDETSQSKPLLDGDQTVVGLLIK